MPAPLLAQLLLPRRQTRAGPRRRARRPSSRSLPSQPIPSSSRGVSRGLSSWPQSAYDASWVTVNSSRVTLDKFFASLFLQMLNVGSNCWLLEAARGRDEIVSVNGSEAGPTHHEHPIVTHMPSALCTLDSTHCGSKILKTKNIKQNTASSKKENLHLLHAAHYAEPT